MARSILDNDLDTLVFILTRYPGIVSRDSILSYIHGMADFSDDPCPMVKWVYENYHA